MDGTLSMIGHKAQPTVASKAASRARHAVEFTWEKVLGNYEALLLGWVSLTGRKIYS